VYVIKNISIIVLVALLVTACDFIPSFKKDERKIVAKVYDSKLYVSDLDKALPKEMNQQDSILFVENYINSWATKQLLLHQAEINLTNEEASFEKLVSDYRSALYINSYKEALVLSKLDSTVSEEQIKKYYEENIDNFRLNEILVQFKYIHADINRTDKKELIQLFRSKKQEDFEKLQAMALEFKAYNFNDSIWIRYEDMKSKIGFLQDANPNKVLKKEYFLKKEDSLGLYLISIKDVLKLNDLAPVSYISPTIEQIILQKRKLELLNKVEVDLLNDAIKNQYFEKY